MDPTNAVTVRPATADDLEVLGAMAAALVHFHHGVDPRRFMLAKGVDEGYRRWFRQELDSPEAMVRVAVGGDGRVLGYTYARVEGRDWNMLLDAHVALHDVFVAPSARGARVGEALLSAFAAEVVVSEIDPLSCVFSSAGNSAERDHGSAFAAPLITRASSSALNVRLVRSGPPPVLMRSVSGRPSGS